MENDIVKINSVENKIIEVRGEKVLLDSDVAALYGVGTKQVNQAVKNNPEKFPKGYVFELYDRELHSLRSKFLTANNPKSRVLPKAFTEKGLYAGNHPQKRACHPNDHRHRGDLYQNP